MEVTLESLEVRLEELGRKLSEVQSRLDRLEGSAPLDRPNAGEADRELRAATPPHPSGEAVIENAENLIPVCGWALLGVAGAYLLRALTEAGLVSGAVGVGAGVLYAAWWLYFSARHAAEKRLQSTIHGLTAAAILAPMLWETTVRFKILSPVVASSILVLFAVFGLVISWRRTISPLAWIVTLTALTVSTALFRVTHDALLWAGTILSLAIAVEFSACRDHWLSLRWIVAVAADISVLVLTFVSARFAGESGGPGTPGSAWTVAMQVGLLTVYLSSTLDRTILRSLSITWFEIGQACVAFAISISGILRIAGTNGGGLVGAGGFCVVAGLGCYAIAFASLDRREGLDRNFYTYSTFALMLMVTGSHVLFQGPLDVIAWCILAEVALAAGILRGRKTLRLHGLFYLGQALVESRLIPWATARVTGAAVWANEAGGSAQAATAFAAVVCYLTAVRLDRRQPPDWTTRISRLLPAAIGCYAAAGLVSGWIAEFVSPAAALRTAFLTLVAVGVGGIGKRLALVELKWLAYPLMTLAGAKLVTEDFREGRSLMLFASLIVFGGGLVLLPRLMRETSPSTRA